MKLPAFVRSAALYTSANLLNALVPILLLPVLTNYLTHSEYGVISMFQVLVMITLPFVGFNSTAAIERQYFNKSFEFSRYVLNVLFVLVLSMVLMIAVYIAGRQTLQNYTSLNSYMLLFPPVYCFFHNIMEAALVIYRLKNKPISYGLLRIGRTVFEIALSIVLVVQLKFASDGRIMAIMAAAILFGLFSLFFIKKEEDFFKKISKEYVVDILKFGGPLIPHVIGGVLMIYTDRLLISRMIGLSETGSYTVGYQVGMAISLLQSSFNMAWVPWFYRQLEQNDDVIKQKIVKFTYLYNVLLLIAVFALTACAPLIFSLFIAASYADSIQYVFWIALGFAFDGMYKMVANYIFFVHKTYWISVITMGVAVLNIALTYGMISWYGAIGAAQATAICFLIEFLVVWIASQRLYRMPWFSLKF